MKNKTLIVWMVLCVSISLAAQNNVPQKNETLMSVTSQIPIKAYSFSLKDVRLLDGPFKTAMQADKNWLMQLSPDRFLNRFHANAGLPTKGAIYGGWESLGISGHSLGHYISAISMLYANTGDLEAKERLDYIIDELERCQNARGTGYIGGIPNEDQLWNQIASGDIRASNSDLNGFWVPWYTLHKLWAGLTDAYLYGGNEKAKAIVIKLTDWACTKFANLNEAQWQQMLNCEFGGMNDALYNVYAITGNQDHLKLAEKFYHKSILDPLSKNINDLPGLHANTQIAKVIGTSRSYELTGNIRDKNISTFFWDEVVHKHSYCIGGNSNSEHFVQPGQMSGELSDKTAETCNTYNMLKLTRHLFAWNPDAKYMDYYERALYNHILASQNPTTGMVCYSVALNQNGSKEFSTPENSFWCCVGTGFENHVKYAEEIYAQSTDGLYINLFIPSELTWTEKGMTVKQETSFPDADNTIITISTVSPQTTKFYIRYPSWVKSGFEIKINNVLQPISNSPGSYVSIDKTWNNGDKIEVIFPKQLTKEALLGDNHKKAFLNGPIVLAGVIENAKRTPIFLDNSSDLNTWIKADKVVPNVFQTENASPEDVKLMPFYKRFEGLYTVYFDCFGPDEWEAVKDEYAKEQERLAELERLTLDYFRPNEQQQEVDHSFKGTNVGRGEYAGRKWCDSNGGLFSFKMKVNPSLPADLVVTYWGGDNGRRKFDILVDDEVIVTEELVGRKPNEFYDDKYLIPYHLTKGKEEVIVKFRAYSGNTAGGIFGSRTLLKKNVSANNIQVDDYMLVKEPYLSAHNFLAPTGRTGITRGRSWVDATSGTISFDVKCSSTKQASLMLSYWGGENVERNFKILVDSQEIAIQKLYMNEPDYSFDVLYTIPKLITKGKNMVTVTLESISNSFVGGLWYAYTFSEKQNVGMSYLKNTDSPIQVFSANSFLLLRNSSNKAFDGKIIVYSLNASMKYSEPVHIQGDITVNKKLEKGVYLIQLVSSDNSVVQNTKIIL